MKEKSILLFISGKTDYAAWQTLQLVVY
jgi:hypothetical protein